MLIAESAAGLDMAALAETRYQARLYRKRQYARLMRFLERGGVLIREECGGVVGVRWGRAHRSGSAFDTATCERLLQQEKLELNWRDGPNRFRLAPPRPAT